MTINVGIILILLREEAGKDFWGTMEKLAIMGFQGIESSLFLQGNLVSNKKRLDDLGLKVVAVGANKDLLKGPLDELVEKVKLLGCNYVVTYWGPSNDIAQVKADAKLYDEIGAQLRKHDLKYCYHNHDHEFTTVFEGKRVIDILMENSDPEHLFFEVDVAWVQYGGEDPVTFLRKHAQRIPIIHLKDIADINERGKFTSIGTGCVDVNSVMRTATELGIDWAVIEQDRVNRLSPFESVQASIYNIKEYGWL